MKECPKDGYKDGEGSKGETCEARLSSAQSRGAEGNPHGSPQLLTGSAEAALSSALWGKHQGLRELHGAASGEGRGVKEKVCTRWRWAWKRLPRTEGMALSC